MKSRRFISLAFKFDDFYCGDKEQEMDRFYAPDVDIQLRLLLLSCFAHSCIHIMSVKRVLFATNISLYVELKKIYDSKNDSIYQGVPILSQRTCITQYTQITQHISTSQSASIYHIGHENPIAQFLYYLGHSVPVA